MKATITLLGRATAAEDFAELWTGTAEVGVDTVSVTPVVPAAAVGHELAISALSSGGSVNFASFAVIPAAPTTEGEPDAEPAAPRVERATSVYATQGAKGRRAPFKGQLVALCRVGTPQPAV